MAKRKVLQFKMISQGEVIDYQTMIEEILGMQIASLKIYDANNDRKSEFNGIEVNDRDRAYFVSDADYEVTITKITN